MSTTIETENPVATEHESPNEMRRLVAAFDWGATPLGPIGEWPQSLKTPVDILLTSRFAMWMGWGPALTFLYNDAYGRMTLGAKHPWALGRPASEVWAEIWGDIGPRIEQVMATGVATWDECLRLFLERNGYPEETYHTFSYSPLSAEDGRVAGMLCVVVEETERVIGERRLASLRDLGAALSEVVDGSESVAGDGPRCSKRIDSTCRSRSSTCSTTPITAASCRVWQRVPASTNTTPAAASNAWPSDAIACAARQAVRRRRSRATVRRRCRPAHGTIRRSARSSCRSRSRVRINPAGYLVAGDQSVPAIRRRLCRFREARRRPDRGRARQRASVRGRAPPRRSARRDRSREDAVLLEREPRVPHAAHAHARSGGRTCSPMRDDADADARAGSRSSIATRCGSLKLVNTLLDFSRIEAGRMHGGLRADRPRGADDGSRELVPLRDRDGGTAADASTVRRCDEPVVRRSRHVGEDRAQSSLERVQAHVRGRDRASRCARCPTTRRSSSIVRDTGIGIPADQLPRLFERFHRVPNARSRTHEGTGIGLALVQELVKLHGGAIHVASEEGAGTTFTVRVPVRHAAHRRRRRAPASIARSHARRRVRRIRQEAARWLPNDRRR